jgi:hypothetical protein
VTRSCGCGIDINGEVGGEYYCKNTVDNDLENYCRVERMREHRPRQSDYLWLPGILKYYWKNSIDQKAVEFQVKYVLCIHTSQPSFLPHSLHQQPLISTLCRDLQHDTYMNAASPYGRTISAFLLVEGWHIRCLLILIGAGLSSSGCLIAIVAAFSQSIEVALTAGSFACGLSGDMIAVFTFLSAVI